MQSQLAFSSNDGNYVEDFGKKGLFGNNSFDLIDHFEGFMGGDFLCEPADENEFDLVNNAGFYHFTNGEEIKNYLKVDYSSTYASIEQKIQKTKKSTRKFDEYIEEILFLEATKRSHDVTKCQVALFERLTTDIYERHHLFKNSFVQFEHLKSELKSLLDRRDLEDENTHKAKMRARERYTNERGNTHNINKEVKAAESLKEQAYRNFAMAVTSIPLGNREPVKEAMIELLRKENVDYKKFRETYIVALNKLIGEVNSSHAFFTEINDKKGADNDIGWYRVNEDLKKALTSSGQMSNVIDSAGLGDDLENKFMCRAKARYQSGPTNLLFAEIPLYFLGAYGLSRVALRAGAAATRAGNAANRANSARAIKLGQMSTQARNTQLAARAGVIGMDVYEYGRIADEIRQACWQKEFILATQNETCNAESELNGVYNEASISSCIIMSSLGVAPLALVGGLRMMSYKNARAIEKASGVEATAVEVVKKAEPTEIVIIGKRVENKFFSNKVRNETWDKLESRGIKINSVSAGEINPLQFRRLSEKEKVAVLEEYLNIAPTAAQAKAILDLTKKAKRTDSVAELELEITKIKDMLRGMGKHEDDIDQVIHKFFKNDIFGNSPSAQVFAKALAKQEKSLENAQGILESQKKLDNLLSGNPLSREWQYIVDDALASGNRMSKETAVALVLKIKKTGARGISSKQIETWRGKLQNLTKKCEL